MKDERPGCEGQGVEAEVGLLRASIRVAAAATAVLIPRPAFENVERCEPLFVRGPKEGTKG